MKKIAALLLALTMVVSIASCGDKNESTTGNTETTNNEEIVVSPKYTSALEVMETAWNSYSNEYWFTNYPDDIEYWREEDASLSDDEIANRIKESYYCGGDYETMVNGAPGNFNLKSEDAASSLEYMTTFPTSEISKIDEAVTFMFTLNKNSFTAGAYHFTNESDVDAGIEAIKTAYANQHWVCGTPDVLVVIEVPGNYVIAAYGLTDYIETFKNAVLNNVENAELVAEQETDMGGDDDWWSMGEGGIVLG